jgi:molybdopterin molybdotransferase
MLELEQAIAHILELIPKPQRERVSLANAHRRILAESISAKIDLPAFDNSAMDGYALRSSDVVHASKDRPVGLKLLGRIEAGKNFSDAVAPGMCVRVFTGSLLPKDADAVVMQEDTLPSEAGEILVTDSVKPWENVRFQGEDIKKGTLLADNGDLLGVGKLSLLAAAGIAQVETAMQPRVTVLATGSELREPGEPLAAGQIYDSNRVGLSVLLRQAGASPSVMPLVVDIRTAVRTALETAFSQSDAIVSSGGVSVGEMDFIKTALADIGGKVEFWRVALKPGRPFVLGRYQEKLFFGLPGNPVSALLTFLLLVRPAVLRWQGAKDVSLPRVPGTMGERFRNSGPRRHFIRVKIDADGKVFSAGDQNSHILNSLAASNGLVDVPPETTLEPGTRVQVFRWGNDEK